MDSYPIFLHRTVVDPNITPSILSIGGIKYICSPYIYIRDKIFFKLGIYLRNGGLMLARMYLFIRFALVFSLV